MVKQSEKQNDQNKELELVTFELDGKIEESIEKDIEEAFEKNEEVFKKNEEDYVSGKDSFSMYLNEIGHFKTVSKEVERELFLRLKAGDESVKEEIFKANARLVIFVAKKYGWVADNNAAIDFEDIVSVGNLGLFKAIDMFDVDLNYKFSTYAYNWIYSFIERFIVNHGCAIRVPAHIYEKIRVLKKKKNEMELTLGRDLSYEEEEDLLKKIVGGSGSEEIIRRFKKWYLVTDIISLNSKVQKGEEADDSEYMEFIESPLMQPEEECSNNLMKEELMNVMKECLTQRQFDVLMYRFGFKTGRTMTLEEVGNIYGVTRERIRQIECRAIRTLRHSYKCRHLKEYILN